MFAKDIERIRTQRLSLEAEINAKLANGENADDLIEEHDDLLELEAYVEPELEKAKKTAERYNQ